MRKLWLYCMLAIFLFLATVGASVRAAPLQISLTQWTLVPRAASSGDQYVLWSAAGQPEAGRLSGGNYVMTGGVRGRAGPPPSPLPGDHSLFLPLITR